MTVINRRIPNIIIPKNESSWNLIYSTQDVDGDYLVLPIPREDLTVIFSSKIFDEINNQFGLMIDEYEEDEISGEANLEKLKGLLANFLNKVERPMVKGYIDKMIIFVEHAIKYNTVMLFYF